jgi:hypothetical protein
MSLDTVWAALPELEWTSAERIQATTGLDYDCLSHILDFLIRWQFVEARNDPELRIRRRFGTISPVDVVEDIRRFKAAESKASLSLRRVKLVERVACRVCGERSFNFVGQNLVECQRCQERQWYAIETEKTARIQELVKLGLGGLRRFLKDQVI